MDREIQDLVNTIKVALPKVIDEWNNVSLPQFEVLYRRPFREVFAGRQTQEKTKAISPIIDEIFTEKIKIELPSFVQSEGNSKDYMVESTWVEWKNSLADNLNKKTGKYDDVSWTGNGYEKTNWHVLVKLIPNEDGVIEKHLSCIIPHDEMKYQWTKPKNSNFSNLKIFSSDLNKVIMITGNFTNKLTYLKPVFENVISRRLSRRYEEVGGR